MATSERVASINTQAGPMEIDTARTAVMVVDMQNDFRRSRRLFDRSAPTSRGFRPGSHRPRNTDIVDELSPGAEDAAGDRRARARPLGDLPGGALDALTYTGLRGASR